LLCLRIISVERFLVRGRVSSMTRSSLIVEKTETGSRGSARMGTSAAIRSPTQPATPVSAITAQYRRAFVEEVAQDRSWLVSIGRVRMRLPVTAKIALVSLA
jgi:hypothetical protein